MSCNQYIRLSQSNVQSSSTILTLAAFCSQMFRCRTSRFTTSQWVLALNILVLSGVIPQNLREARPSFTELGRATDGTDFLDAVPGCEARGVERVCTRCLVDGGVLDNALFTDDALAHRLAGLGDRDRGSKRRRRRRHRRRTRGKLEELVVQRPKEGGIRGLVH